MAIYCRDEAKENGMTEIWNKGERLSLSFRNTLFRKLAYQPTWRIRSRISPL
jgi:hypothetical protein